MLEFNLLQPKPPSRPPEEPDEGALYDLIIIGGGPAGLTAAIYAGRAAVRALLITGPSPGGQMGFTELVENYPGFPDGVSGTELGQLMERQAGRFGTRVEMDSVKSVDLAERPFTVRTYAKTYRGRAMIVATGAVPRMLGVPGEKEFFGRGVSTCATCDGFFYQGKKVVVVGGGDSAIDEGLVLTRFADQVTIVHRRDQLRATKIYQERAFANPKMRFMWDSVVEEIVGERNVRGVRVRNVKTDESSLIEADGVFLYIGMIPKTRMFEGQLELDEWGYIVTNERFQSSVPGVFVAGDVQDPDHRQIVVAAGAGAVAALEAERFITEHP